MALAVPSGVQCRQKLVVRFYAGHVTRRVDVLIKVCFVFILAAAACLGAGERLTAVFNLNNYALVM